MIISHIVAVGLNGVIGNEGQLPWHVPEDLQRFKALTMNKTLIMGRVTFQGLPKKLEGRRIIVVSRKYKVLEGAEVVSSLEEAIARCAHDNDEIFIAGGETLYRKSMSMTNRVYLTEIAMRPSGDSFYPLAQLSEFSLAVRAESADPQVVCYKTLNR